MNVIPIGSARSLFDEQLRLRLAEELLCLVRAQQDHDELQIQVSRCVMDDLAQRNDRVLGDDLPAADVAAG